MKDNKQQIVVRDWHLKQGDKVKVDNLIYTFIKMDWAYAKWLDSNWVMATGLFNYLVYDEEEKLYKPDKKESEG